MRGIFTNYYRALEALDSQCRRLIILYFIRSISAGITFFIGIYLSHIHMKWSIIGYEVTSLALGNLLGSWFAAKYADKLDPYKASAVSMAIQGLCFLAIATSNHASTLAVSVFIYGVAGYFYIAISNFLITSMAGEDSNARAHAISLSSIASNLGMLTGGLLVSLLSSKHPALLFSLVGCLLLITSSAYLGKHQTAQHINKSNHTDDTTPNRWIYLLGLTVTFLLGIIFAQQRVGYLIFLDNYFSGTQISLILGLNTVLIITVQPSITHWMMKFKNTASLGLGSMLLSLGMYLAIYSHNYSFILLLCVVRTVGEMMASIMSQFICFQFSPKHSRGHAMGTYKFIFAIGVLLGSYVGGEILTYMSINAIWDLCGILGIIIFAACAFFKPKDQQSNLLLN